MNEPRAWQFQADADLRCANYLLASKESFTRCNVIAKYQQSVEKSLKGLVASLRDYRGLSIHIGWTHPVERFMSVLTRLPRSSSNRDIQSLIHGMLDESTRSHIRALDRLVPHRPPPGLMPALNTESPFHTLEGWRAPAEPSVFAREDVDRFRMLAHRVVRGCSRLMSAIERGS